MEPVTSALAFLFFGFIAVVLLVIAVKTIRIVPQATVMLVERLGRFDKVASSGLNILVPFLDKPRAVFWTNTRPGLTSIDLREQYIDLPPQPDVFTSAPGELVLFRMAPHVNAPVAGGGGGGADSGTIVASLRTAPGALVR